MLQKETRDLLAQVVEKWDSLREGFLITPEEYSGGGESKIGKIWWDNPTLVWILVTNNEEGYEGSQSQVGVAKDGQLRWEFQSHCSCDNYENTTDLPPQFTEDSLKSFDFTYTKPPLDWEMQMQKNMRKLLV